ncbi:MAG: hypothetical protein K2R93_02830 [Gemmatimonadaceae bacterium]|nr:hypothetical protein [Gemmatimonadaceae bacterium]
MRLSLAAPFLVAASLLTACGSPLTAPADLTAASAMLDNARGDAVFIIDGNGCSDDMIGIGSAQFQRSLTTPASGGFIAWIDVDIRGEAFNTRGERYRFASSERQSFRVTSGDAYTLTSRLRLIGQGAAPNIDAKLSYKVAFNPNGELTVYRDSYRISCE